MRNQNAKSKSKRSPRLCQISQGSKRHAMVHRSTCILSLRDGPRIFFLLFFLARHPLERSLKPSWTMPHSCKGDGVHSGADEKTHGFRQAQKNLDASSSSARAEGGPWSGIVCVLNLPLDSAAKIAAFPSPSKPAYVCASFQFSQG
jgi:hypothetical protein